MSRQKRLECHTHTFFSDGVLSPVELVRRAYVSGHGLICMTDHADFTNLEHVLNCQNKILGNISWDIDVRVGVELTHIPVDKMEGLAGKARDFGAQVVIVHGESPVEPVEVGTNEMAVSLKEVDILAHPGNTLTVEQAEKARENEVFLELTTRRGHSQGNKHVVKVGLEAGAGFIVDTDAHEPDDFITFEQALKVAEEAGLPKEEAFRACLDNPLKVSRL